MTRSAQIRRTMAQMHERMRPGDEVHHIFGRIGRLAACRYFCVPLSRPAGGANHHDLPPSVLQRFRDQNRADYLAMIETNESNRDVTTCWWEGCWFFHVCPLAEEPPK